MRELTRKALAQLDDGEIGPGAESRAELAARYLIRLQFGVRSAEREGRFEQTDGPTFGEISTLVGLENTVGAMHDTPEASLEVVAFGHAITEMNQAIEIIYDGMRA